MAGGDAVQRVRAFNRFYTRMVGALDEGHLDSEHSLAEVRVLFELAHRDRPTASEIGRDLALDPGYLSRLLRSLSRRRLVRRTRSARDGRQSHLELTATGRKAFDALNDRTNQKVGQWLAPLDAASRRSLVESMDRIHRLFARKASTAAAPFTLRSHQPGDMGWVVQSHGALYAREYAWDGRFEGLVAHIVGDFLEHFDAARERCWIAEREGVNVGSIFVVKHPEREGVAKLRLLLVDPDSRGLGIGARLVEECICFARHAGYHTMTLWTQDVLASARRLYQAAGFTLVKEEGHHSFGHDLVAQVWERSL